MSPSCHLLHPRARRTRANINSHVVAVLLLILEATSGAVVHVHVSSRKAELARDSLMRRRQRSVCLGGPCVLKCAGSEQNG
eukprot:14859288-Alexandrium_andersonii.AAC.1